jgi:hypothetical protein
MHLSRFGRVRQRETSSQFYSMRLFSCKITKDSSNLHAKSDITGSVNWYLINVAVHSKRNGYEVAVVALTQNEKSMISAVFATAFKQPIYYLNANNRANAIHLIAKSITLLWWFSSGEVLVFL